MSYVKIYLPKLDILKKQIQENPNKIKYYSKYGSLIGPSESVKFLEKLINERS